MANKYVGAKLTERKHADIIAWIDQNEINVNKLLIHLLRVSMTIGITSVPPETVELNVGSEVIPDEAGLSDIEAMLDAIG